MARLLSELETTIGAGADGDVFFRLGMMYATGRTVPLDRVSAHKWLNLAAAKGSAEALRLRKELAEEMSRDEVVTAQRLAREWMRLH